MRVVRHSAFETNSSSTHSICVSKQVPCREFDVPRTITFRVGQFGWERSRLDTPEAKASYLYTAMLSLGEEHMLDEVVNMLARRGITVVLVEPGPEDNFYIDHVGELGDFFKICKSIADLLNYLFSPSSFVMTGNDNSDHDVSIHVNYPHDEYYKDN